MKLLTRNFAIFPPILAAIAALTLSACGAKVQVAKTVQSAPLGQSLNQDPSSAISEIGWFEDPVQVTWTFNSTADVNFTIQSCDVYNSCSEIAVLTCIGLAQCVATDANSGAVLQYAHVQVTTQNGVKFYSFINNDMQAFSSNGSRSGNVRLSAIGMI